MKKFAPQHLLSLIILIIPTILWAGLIYLNLRPFGWQQQFSFTIGAQGDTDAKSSFHLKDLTKEGRLSEPIIDEQGRTFREVYGGPIYFELRPHTQLDERTELSLTLKFKGEADLFYASTDYRQSTGWQAFYLKDLASFKKLGQYEEFQVYGQKESLSPENEEGFSAERPLDNLAPTDAISFVPPLFEPWLLYKDFDASWADGQTEVNALLRNPNYLIYTVLEDNLSLYLEKSDLNWYPGPDPLKVSVVDPQGQTILSKELGDDGSEMVDKTSRAPQPLSIENELSQAGIYLIKLEGGADVVINLIRINSRKLVFQGYIYPVARSATYLAGYAPDAPVNLYTAPAAESSLFVQNSHHEAYQEIVLYQEGLAALSWNINQIGNFQLGLPAADTHAPLRLELSRADLALQASLFWAFSPEAYFNPLRAWAHPKFEAQDEFVLLPLTFQPAQVEQDLLVAQQQLSQEYRHPQGLLVVALDTRGVSLEHPLRIYEASLTIKKKVL